MPTKAVFTEDPNTDIRSPMEKVVFDSASKLKRQGEKPLNVKTAYTETFNQLITMENGINFGKNQIFGTNFFPDFNAWQYYSSMETKRLRPTRNIVFSYGIFAVIAGAVTVESIPSFEIEIFFHCLPFLASRITQSASQDTLLFQVRIGVMRLVEFSGDIKFWEFVPDGDIDFNSGAGTIQGSIDLNRDIVAEHEDYFIDGQKTNQTMLDYFIENGDFLTFRIAYDQDIVATWPANVIDSFNVLVGGVAQFYTTASFVYYSTSVANTLK